MKFSLIICTYKRPQALQRLLDSVAVQILYPSEIIIVDGSDDDATESMLDNHKYVCLRYFRVPPEHRGLTRQRNFGIERVELSSDVVCFLDDDTVLEEAYFKELIGTYEKYPDALGVGGYITNESETTFVGNDYQPTKNEFFFDGWVRKEGSRFVVRKMLGLDSDKPPGFSPEFSHGRSVGFLPPSGKTYRVEQLMGGVSSFRRQVFETHRFSEFFDGYGLYEDADFTFRVAATGALYCNTAARLAHYHDAAGRPNQYRYGKMVVRNGWYVWRVRHPKPSLKARIKWNLITLVLTGIRFSNTFTTPQRREAFTEALGRTVAWLTLFFTKPR